eukprot:m.142072 g.142072  ORF g.142072 m.142072 type:complete len:389 (-) comp14872_c0_seq7:161-1327(-)
MTVHHQQGVLIFYLCGYVPGAIRTFFLQRLFLRLAMRVLYVRGIANNFIVRRTDSNCLSQKVVTQEVFPTRQELVEQFPEVLGPRRQKSNTTQELQRPTYLCDFPTAKKVTSFTNVKDKVVLDIEPSSPRVLTRAMLDAGAKFVAATDKSKFAFVFKQEIERLERAYGKRYKSLSTPICVSPLGTSTGQDLETWEHLDLPLQPWDASTDAMVATGILSQKVFLRNYILSMAERTGPFAFGSMEGYFLIPQHTAKLILANPGSPEYDYITALSQAFASLTALTKFSSSCFDPSRTRIVGDTDVYDMVLIKVRPNKSIELPANLTGADIHNVMRLLFVRKKDRCEIALKKLGTGYKSLLQSADLDPSTPVNELQPETFVNILRAYSNLVE